MSVEPGIVDTNVLVYAFDADAQQHLASRSLPGAARNGATKLYVTTQILCEFYSIVTNSRRVAKPRSAADTVTAIEGILSFVHVLPTPAHTVQTWLDPIRRRSVTGAEVFDLQLAATMLANGVHRIYTCNATDFETFSELEVSIPELGAH
jgi:predicted nucleic acid-binding protein